MPTYIPGDTIYGYDTFEDVTGAALDITVNTIELYHSLTGDGSITLAGATITVTHVTTGVYIFSAVLPGTYNAREPLQFLLNATISGVAQNIWVPIGQVGPVSASGSPGAEYLTTAEQQILKTLLSRSL